MGASRYLVSFCPFSRIPHLWIRTNAALQALVAGLSHVSGVHSVSLVNNNIDGSAAGQIVEVLAHIGVSSLDLSGNPIGNTGAAAIAASIVQGFNLQASICRLAESLEGASTWLRPLLLVQLL